MTAPRSAIMLWAGISLADALGFGMVAPMLPFIAVRYGASAGVITQLVAIYGVATFAGGPLLGALSDRVGRLLVVKSSLLVSAIGFILMALASSLAPIFLFRAITGICAGRNSVVRAILADATPQEKHLGLIGWLAAAGAAGACLGPAVAGLVVWSIPDGRLQFLFVCNAAGAANLAFLLLVELHWSGFGPTHTRRGSGVRSGWGSVLWSGGFPIILFQIGACAYCQGVLYSVTPLLVLKRFGWGAMETGGLLAMTAFLAIFVRLFVLDSLGRLLGPASLVRLYSAVLCLALVGMGVASSVAIFLCAFAAISTAMGVAAVLPTALAASRSLGSMRGARLGICQGTGALSLAFGASVSGLLFDRVGENSPSFVAAGMAAIGMCLTPWLARQEDAADRAG